jgi:S-formylglutathione hydrolase FrmB
LNNHPTFGLDDPCKLAGTLPGVGLAGLFAARGAVGVAPDHPGLGTPGLHPYLVSRVEGASALDALRATRTLGALLKVPLSGRNAVVGLSQGGHATLAAAAMHAAYAPELEIRAFGATAPASARERLWASQVRAGDDRIVYLAMTFYAWAQVYGPPAKSLWAPDFSGKVDDLMASLCLLSDSGPSLTTSISRNPAEVFSSGFLDEYTTGLWRDYTVIRDAFAANAVGPYTQTAPLRIYQGDADTTVPESDTRNLVEVLRAGGVSVDYRVVPGGTHTNVAFGFVAFDDLRLTESLAWVQAQLEHE